jgi:hypothetical protein
MLNQFRREPLGRLPLRWRGDCVAVLRSVKQILELSKLVRTGVHARRFLHLHHRSSGRSNGGSWLGGRREPVMLEIGARFRRSPAFIRRVEGIARAKVL